MPDRASKVINQKFFSEDLPLISNNEELTAVINSLPELDVGYVSTGCIADRKERLERLWEIYREHAEGNFLTEVKTKGKFNERTWEMYLGGTFIAKNYNLIKKSESGPDLHLNVDGRTIYIEATAPGRGTVDAAPERPNLVPGVIHVGGGNIEEIARPRILRITAAVRNKLAQYQKNVEKGVVDPNQPYVIAINGHGFCGIATDEDYLMRRSFFSAGLTSYPYMSDGTLGQPFYNYSPVVVKQGQNGPEVVETDLFLNDKCKDLSAVLFCKDDVINCPIDSDQIGNNLVLLRNPFAKNKIPDNFADFAREWISDGAGKVSFRPSQV